MKRLSITFVIFLLAFFSCGCIQQNYINNTGTGEIPLNDRPSFHDGHWTASSQFYSSNGYCESLTIEIHEGIITKAVFSETDANGNPRTVPPAQCEVSINELYLSMITSLIQNQNADIDSIPGAAEIEKKFTRLAEAAIILSQKGTDDRTELPLGDLYSVKKEWAAGSVSVFNITFDDADNITEAEYNESLNDIPTDSKSFFNSLSDSTVKRNNLSSLPINAEHAETCSHYNEMLNQIASLRESGLKE